MSRVLAIASNASAANISSCATGYRPTSTRSLGSSYNWCTGFTPTTIPFPQRFQHLHTLRPGITRPVTHGCTDLSTWNRASRCVPTPRHLVRPGGDHEGQHISSPRATGADAAICPGWCNYSRTRCSTSMNARPVDATYLAWNRRMDAYEDDGHTFEYRTVLGQQRPTVYVRMDNKEIQSRDRNGHHHRVKSLCSLPASANNASKTMARHAV